ncbi:MAG: sulfatase [Bryobacteraceae bacterium]
MLSRRSLLQSAGLGAASAAQAPGSLPNLVFLISDDHSFPDLGCYGNNAIHTPNLDRMAREGMRFERAFVASPQCSPNRSSIFTGCTPHTTSTSRLHTPMPEWEPSFLEPLKERGYFTGAFRKVHQGDEFNKRFHYYGSAREPFERFFDALPGSRPFFLHVGFTDPHRPYRKGAFSPPHDAAKVHVPPFLPDSPAIRADIAQYYDAIARMDSDSGRIFQLLQDRGLSGNTLVVMTGDNGMPFPRAKGGCYDPGIRVPMLAWWPGKIRPGSVTREMVSHVDLPVTWLDAAGIAKPRKMQGASFLPVLEGRSHQGRSEVFAERNWHNTFDPIRSIRAERYKLIYNAAGRYPYRPASDLAASPTWQSYLELARKGELSPVHMRLLDPSRPLLELYDLDRDPNEFHNLATSPDHAEVLAGLQRRLSAWMHQTYDFLPPLHKREPPVGGATWLDLL